MAATKELIKRIRLTSSATSISFYNIPQDFDDLEIVVSARTTDTGGGIVLIYPNGSTSNLSNRNLLGNGSSASSASGTGEIYGRTADTSRTASTFGSVSFYIPNYASSNYKSISVEGVDETNATGVYMNIQAGLWSSNSAITSIDLKPGGSLSFVAYTSAALYGYKGGSDGTTTVA